MAPALSFQRVLLARPCPGPDTGGFMEKNLCWPKGPDERGVMVLQPKGVPGYHPGRDVGVPVGTPLLSPVDGVVAAAGWQDPTNPKVGFGRYVLLVPKKGYLLEEDGARVRPLVYLGHLSEIFAVVGAELRAGVDHVGLSGATGAVTGPHVHGQVNDPRAPGIRPLPFEWATTEAYRAYEASRA